MYFGNLHGPFDYLTKCTYQWIDVDSDHHVQFFQYLLRATKKQAY